MEFDQIVLTEEELSALKELRDANRENKWIKVTPENKAVFDRLVHFELAEVRYSSEATTDNIVTLPLPKAAYITDKGLDYLSYLDGKRKERQRDWKRDIILLLIGSLVTLFFEHIFDLINFVGTFFQTAGN